MAISRETDDAMAHKLLHVYGQRFTAELADQLIEGLTFHVPPLTDEDYIAAVSKWCATEKWPPLPADILNTHAAITAAAAAQDKGAHAKYFKVQEAELERPVSVTRKTIEIMGVKLTHDVGTYHANCPDCSDRGIAHFYADREDRRRVYLNAEYDEMSDEQKRTYSHQIALCDCVRGREHPHRAWRTVQWHKGRDREMSAYPLMEVVRELSARRKRAAEAGQVPTIEEGRYGY